MVAVRASFFRTQTCKNSLLISTTDFEKATSYFSTTNPAFSQAYIFHICVSFFTSNLESQHSTSALSTTGFFSTFCSQKKKISHGRTASYLSRPHTDPDLRNYRIRLFSYISCSCKKHMPNTNQQVYCFYALALVQLENIVTYLENCSSYNSCADFACLAIYTNYAKHSDLNVQDCGYCHTAHGVRHTGSGPELRIGSSPSVTPTVLWCK